VYRLVKKFLAVYGTLHRVHERPPLTPTASQISPAHATSYFLKKNVNIIAETKPGSFNGFFPSRFPTKILYASLLSPIRSHAVS
jgi:hypothetical protein